MRKFVAGILFVALLSNSAARVSLQRKVYICTSSSTYVYHQRKDCRGFKSCTYTVKTVTEDEAINTHGRIKCKVCD